MKRMLYVLIVLAFGSMTFAQNNVTFKVNMSVKAKKGQFTIGADTVKIAGTINNWNPFADIMVKGANDTTYSITKSLPAGNIEFKFLYGGTTWENVPNRTLNVTGAQTYTAYFDNDSVFSAPKPIVLTFVANMELEIFAQRFNPARPDTLTIRGSFNDWSSNTILLPDPLEPSTYIGSITDTLGVEETLNFKLAYMSASGTNWENDPNKTYTITQADYDAGAATISRTFNDLNLATITNNPVTVTIAVDMTNAVSAITGQPFPSIDNVVIAGANSPLAWPGAGWPNSDSALVFRLFNDGSNGDSLANDNIWTRNITFPIFSPLKIEYKFGANWGLPSNTGGNDNELSVGTNHWIRLHPFTTTGKVLNKWAVMDTLNLYNEVLGVKEIGTGVPQNYSLDQNYPNPFNPTTNIRFNLPDAGLVTLKIYNVLGQEVAILLNEYRNAGSYEFTFDASKLNSGVYFYTISTNNFISTKKMTLVK